METIPKPDELLALHDVTALLFDTLQVWFDVPDEVALDLSDIDAAVTSLGDPVMIAAISMRKLQALRLLSTPGVRTSTDVIVSIVQDLNRALLQAPAMRLRRQAEATDWDAALVDLVEHPSPADPSTAPVELDEGEDAEDAETQAFRALHAKLHEAAVAVLRASDGEIRYLE